MRRATSVFASSVLVVLTCGLANAQVRDVGTLEETVIRLEDEMTRVERIYQGEIALGFQRSFADRASAGELYYLLGEYDRASTILFGAVEPAGVSARARTDEVGYADAVYQLGDSLFQLGNYGAARGYYEKLLRLPSHGYRTQAISGLLRIADRLSDYRNIDFYYDLFKRSSSVVPSDVRYVHSKSLFRAGRDADTLNELKDIAPGDPFFMRARYLIGATYVRAGNDEKALEIFENLVKQKPVSLEDNEVLEFAHLAKARLLYDADKLDEALDTYQYVDWESDQLATMLYEVTWTYVRRGQLKLRNPDVDESTRKAQASHDYELALAQLEDLRALTPEQEGQADLTLLRGNLELQRRRFADAEATFRRLLGEYRAADDKMAAMLADEELRPQILQEIINGESGQLSVNSRLPAVAVRRASQDPEVADAIRVFKDLKQSARELAATKKKLVTLQELLSAANRGERFPQLQGGFIRAYSIDNTLLDVLGALVSSAEERGGTNIGGELQTIRNRRKLLWSRVQRLPKTGEALTQRKQGFDAGYAELERKLYELDLMLDTMRAQLVAVDLLYQQSEKEKSSASPQALLRYRRRLQELDRLVTSHEKTTTALREQLLTAKRSTTISGGRGSGERALRNEFADIVRQELNLARSQLGGRGGDIVRVAERAQRLREREQNFVGRLDSTADRYIRDVRVVVDAESVNLAQYEQDLLAVGMNSKSIREDATTIALQSVRRDLFGVVLRSDVGVIDVAFAKKQSETNRISALQRAKSAELTDLNTAYADLTEDEVD